MARERALLCALLLALGLIATAASAEGEHAVTKKFVGLWSNQVMYLDAHTGGSLLCDELGLGHGVGGVCFEVLPGTAGMFFEGQSSFGVPAAALFWVNAEGAYLRSDRSCLFDFHDVPVGAARVMVLVFQPSEANGCNEMDGPLGPVVGAAGEGRITARYWP